MNLIALAPEALLLLRPDVEIHPVADFDDRTRSQLGGFEGDFVLTRRGSRLRSSVLDKPSAELLGTFKQPRNLSEAVILYSLPRRLDPQAVLEDAFDLVQRFLRKGVLAIEGDPELEDGPLLEVGDEVDGFLVLRTLQRLEDVEVHQGWFGTAAGAGRFGVVKIARREHDGNLEHEAKVLEALGGRSAPRLLGRGTIDAHPYLLIEWCPGVDSQTAATELRQRGPAGRRDLLGLMRAVTEAFAGLHEAGWLHGDVHPRNVLVDRSASGEPEVRLLDLGLARAIADAPELQEGLRAGVAYFLEPEAAARCLADGHTPSVSETGEQYAVAALLYQLATGYPTHDFNLERQHMLTQIAQEPPKAFEDRGEAPWPELEAVLARALAKKPEDRFANLRELGLALAALEPAPVSASQAPTPLVPSALAERSRKILAALDEGGAWAVNDLPAPRASVNFGAAGVAYALVRIAGQRQDPLLLALAETWNRRAERAMGTALPDEEDPAFHNAERELGRALVGSTAPYHAASGVWAVASRIAASRGDLNGFAQGIRRFADAAAQPGGDPLDLCLGRAGNLLVAALLLDVRLEGVDRESLLAFGHQAWQETAEALAKRPVLTARTPGYLGLAHGWGGPLYALLQWRRASGAPLAEGVVERLDQLARQAMPKGRGLAWRWGDLENSQLMPGWCHGAAGYVFLWSLAGRVLGEPGYFDLALAAGWEAWDDPNPIANLCCGLTGRSYALLHLAKHSGDRIWLDRARVLARRAAQAEQPGFVDDAPWSLYKGELALAVLAADLEVPEEAVFPVFEEEGWDRAPGWER